MNENGNALPYHVGLIVDGNGRWAKKRGLIRSLGHLEGSKTLKKVALYAFERGIKVLSIYIFSTENFKRSVDEVSYLMDLFIKDFEDGFQIFNERNVKVVFSRVKNDSLPKRVEEAVNSLEETTKNNTAGILNVCLNYGGRQEIVDTTKSLVKQVLANEISIDDIDEDMFSKNLYQPLPPLDLLIRTSGEQRLSNFMLWQNAYAELYFPDILFPDFNEAAFDEAIMAYNKRDRRFGGIKDEGKTS